MSCIVVDAVILGSVVGFLFDKGEKVTAKDAVDGLNSSVRDTIDKILSENNDRLKLERDWMNRLKDSHDRAFSSINSYIVSILNLVKNDDRFSELKDNRDVISLIKKRNNIYEQIKDIRGKAIKSNDEEEIVNLEKQARNLFEVFQGEIQSEVINLTKLGIDMSEYSSLHEDAIKLALAKKNEVVELKLKSIQKGQVVTEEMLNYDKHVFEEAISEFLCNRDLNDKQFRDIMAIKTMVRHDLSDENLSLEIKKKRLVTSFEIFNSRKNEVELELSQMREYYEAYLTETFDVPEIRLELSEFNSIDEIFELTQEAKKLRVERLKKQYVQTQVDNVMKKHGLNVIESEVVGRKEDDKRVLYGVDEKTAIDVYVSDNNKLSTHVVGINFSNEEVSQKDKDEFENKGHKVCSKIVEIEDDLEELGIHLSRQKTVPPKADNSEWIQIANTKKLERKAFNRKNRKRTNNRVMYME